MAQNGLRVGEAGSFGSSGGVIFACLHLGHISGMVYDKAGGFWESSGRGLLCLLLFVDKNNP